MNIAVFVPVRLSSTRLPGKSLLDLHGKTCLQRLVERIKRAKNVDEIILCTTNEPEDDKLVEIAKKMEIKLYRGNTSDLIDRYYHAAKKFNIEVIVNVDGDDIFCDSVFIDKSIEELQNTEIDFVMWKDLPLGTTPLGIKVKALNEVWNLKDTTNTETGWAKFFTDTGMFKVRFLSSENSQLKDSTIRLTLDYQEDFKLFEKIYENLVEPFSLEDILSLLKQKPELRKINNNLDDIYRQNFERKSANIKMKNSK